ncbi:MAG: PEP-CTERM sorting domain-containing protein [Phenylobacterium sp.]|uniref:PEPxxWA-CTERM sorting domain-containing protein n=1 Tax=Phenylobacterium sp. TaxID=1871053 RepID=UPI001A582572|nr:PEPxxWA-CTERM sorting domain-containing protein [Phenylobacterium sp.]MBL8772620.1 PEP-CTERM sorting domain-containing protein [Phenylobacterium sp.]
MKLHTILAGAVATVALGSAAQAATLAGDTIDINLNAGGTDYGTQTVLVGAGDDASYFANQYIDLDAGVAGDLFTVRSTSNYCGIVCGGRVTWTLTSLNFGTPLTGFTVLQSIAPVTIDALTATSVTFSYNDVSIPTGVYFQARFETGDVGGVPEPSTWALMIGGFGLAGAALRGRKQAAAQA